MRPVLLLALAFGLPFSMVYGVWPIWVANDRGFGQQAYSQLWGWPPSSKCRAWSWPAGSSPGFGRHGTLPAGMATFGGDLRRLWLVAVALGAFRGAGIPGVWLCGVHRHVPNDGD
jgi:hypothetical protein